MSDPVDTDALRDVAVVLEGHHSWNDEAEAADLLRVAAVEVDRLRAEMATVSINAGLRLEELRAVIENAPHEWTCPARQGDHLMCLCWKADVL
ncbi:hypothetical protein [Curtobacterium sp. SORGH_AS_0776]|uniref:hypothetical protein n=1 Tax=Curtobacterium sp. SORGH_AS_0776 TaxID=3041798 RepID=UPI0028542459|nr:hypothetical protein [Curtobacterium sp. SORGH_AS_0776]MDR6172669.1 hypothetical protein [Curtobacterium sp. SORGH_AS_0776]